MVASVRLEDGRRQGEITLCIVTQGASFRGRRVWTGEDGRWGFHSHFKPKDKHVSNKAKDAAAKLDSLVAVKQ